jgi:hypothetical protein
MTNVDPAKNKPNWRRDREEVNDQPSSAVSVPSLSIVQYLSTTLFLALRYARSQPYPPFPNAMQLLLLPEDVERVLNRGCALARVRLRNCDCGNLVSTLRCVGVRMSLSANVECDNAIATEFELL